MTGAMFCTPIFLLMKAADMQLVHGSHANFKNEKTALEHVLYEKQHAIYLPKFHCELNPIERVWGEAKHYTRSHYDYTFAGLERTIVPAIESVWLDTIHKHFRKCKQYMQAYREGNKRLGQKIALRVASQLLLRKLVCSHTIKLQ